MPADASPRELLVVSILDPALDRNPPSQTAAIERYAERRTVDAFAEVRLWTNNPAAFRLRALSPVARTRCLSMGGTPAAGDRYSPQQMLAAVRMGVVAVIREATITDGIPSGAEDALPTLPDMEFPVLTDAAVESLGRDFGGAVLDELGTLILDRSAMHPRRLVGFSLPRSSRDQM